VEFVTLFNRTQRDLEGTWDGRTYTAKPGKNAYPLAIAEAIKRRNPIAGSDDAMTGNFQHLLGIEEQGDDCSPIEQSDEIELYNRRLQKNAIPIMVIPGNTGMYAVKRADFPTPLTQDSTFVKP